MNTSKEILYSTPGEQIQKLKSKNLYFENEDFAKTQLAEYKISLLVFIVISLV